MPTSLSQLIAFINQYINANGRGLITGPILASVLIAIVSFFGVYYATVDRVTNSGITLNARYDLALKCDGQTNDTAALAAATTTLNAAATPVTVILPGVCLIDVPTNNTTEYTFTNSVTFEGVNDAASGFTVATAGENISGTLFKWLSPQSAGLRKLTLNLNGLNSPTTNSSVLYFQAAGKWKLEDVSVIGAGTVGAAVPGSPSPQLNLVNCIGFTSGTVDNSYFAFNAPQNTPNGAINCGSVAFQSSGLTVTNSRSQYTQLTQHIGVNHVTISGNQCYGAAYGACYGSSPFFGDATAAGSWAVNATTITLAAAVPSWVIVGDNVFNSSPVIVQSVSGSTITLTGPVPPWFTVGDTIQDRTQFSAIGTIQSIGSNTITFTTTVPSFVVAFDKIADTTTLAKIGSVASISGNTFTISGTGAQTASITASDTVRFSDQREFDVTWSNNMCGDTGSALDINGTYVQCYQNWVTGAHLVGNKGRNSCGPVFSIAARTDVENNTAEDPGSCLGGPLQQAAFLANLSVNSGVTSDAGGSTFKGNTARNVNTNNGTYGYADNSAVGLVYLGVNAFSTMPSGGYLTQGSATWLQETNICRSTIPFIMPPTFTFGTNGSFTLSTALGTTYANAYMYFPANAINGSNAAGWYFVQMSSATAGTAYNNTYANTSVATAPPSTLTPFTNGAPGVVAPSTAALASLYCNVPKSALGTGGQITVDASVSNSNSANAKAVAAVYGTYTFGQNAALTTSLSGGFHAILSQQGATNAQVPEASWPTFGLGTNVLATTYGNTASTTLQPVKITLKSTNASDYIVLEAANVRFDPSP